MKFNQYKVSLKVAFLGVYLLPISNVQAYEFIKDFSVPSTVQYDSNVNMSRSNKNSAFRFIANPRLTLSSLNETNSFNLNGSLNVVRSTDRVLIEDREDPSLSFGWAHSYEKGVFNLNGNYSRQSTRVSELNESGLIFNDGTSTAKGMNASLSYDLTDRFRTRFRAGYNERRYSTFIVGLTDFDTGSYGVNFSYQNSEKLSTNLDLAYTKTNYGQTATPTPSNDSKSVSVGFDYIYSPVLNLNASLGTNKVSTSTSSGFIASGSMSYQIDNDTSLSAGLSRNTTPSGLGDYIETDSLYVKYRKVLSSFDDAGVDFRWSNNKTINTTEFKSVNMFYNRELTPSWAAKGSLSGRFLGGNNSGAASGYQVGLTVIYNNFNF